MISQLDDIQWGKLVAEAWINPNFKTELDRDPAAAVREFAEQHFGLQLDGDIDTFELPELPPGMLGERLSGSGEVRGTITASATASGDARGEVRGTITASATSGGDIRGTITASATASGDVRGTITASATASGDARGDNN